MNKLMIATAAAALMLSVSGPASAAMAAADCEAMFQKADVSKDGSLQADESKLFLDAMNEAQLTPKDASVVTKDEFVAACQKDAFAKIDPATIGAADSTAASAEQPATTTEQTTTTTEQPATDQSTTTTTQTTTTDETAQQPAEEEQALAAPEAFMASDLLGTTIYSASNENLGELKDIVLSQDGQPTHAIVDVGDKDVAIDLSQLKLAATEDGLKVVMNAAKADLEAMPAIADQNKTQNQ